MITSWAMDWKNQLTKTPYLVLFIVLLTVGVGTASAAITFSMAGNLHILGDLIIDEAILLGNSNPNNDDGIRFDDGSEIVFWDESENKFRITDDMVLDGEISCPNCILGFYNNTVDFDVEGSVGIGLVVDCDAGDKAIGGSWDDVWDLDTTLTNSHLNFEGDGWQTRLEWDSAAPQNAFIRFGVMCADYSPAHIP